MRAELGLPPLVAEGETQSSPNSNESDERIAEMAQRIEALEAEVAQLRQQTGTVPPPTTVAKAGPRWMEQDAIGIVKRELQASTSGCLGYERPVDQHECYLKDPVLGGMRPALAELPPQHVGAFVSLVAERALAENTQWSAVFEVNQEMWRVEAIAEGIGSTLLFYVNESTGLVEGAPFTE
jgi:hypothetical protein